MKIYRIIVTVGLEIRYGTIEPKFLNMVMDDDGNETAGRNYENFVKWNVGVFSGFMNSRKIPEIKRWVFLTKEVYFVKENFREFFRGNIAFEGKVQQNLNYQSTESPQMLQSKRLSFESSWNLKSIKTEMRFEAAFKARTTRVKHQGGIYTEWYFWKILESTSLEFSSGWCIRDYCWSMYLLQNAWSE